MTAEGGAGRDGPGHESRDASPGRNTSRHSSLSEKDLALIRAVSQTEAAGRRDKMASGAGTFHKKLPPVPPKGSPLAQGTAGERPPPLGQEEREGPKQSPR